MHLIVVHYHLRPGGVRRVVELGLPHVVAALEAGRSRRTVRVTLACGEPADSAWQSNLQGTLAPRRVDWMIEPAFGYFEEQDESPRALRQRLNRAMSAMLRGVEREQTVVWAHNLGLARNLLLTEALVRACEQCGVPLMAHHHDWWFDHRWQRWPEIRASGFRSLGAAARVVFPATRTIRHLTINRVDAAVLRRHCPRLSAWVPNLMEPSASAAAMAESDRGRVRRWLRGTLGDSGPVWLVPCRVLRRKNLAEALLLTRWLRPEAWLVTTGGVSSPDEHPYAERLESEAARRGWRLRLGILASGRRGAPGVTSLQTASEVILLTSIQEGFGLPYLEAAAVRRPLMARVLPLVWPDLRRFGFVFPYAYEEIRVPLGLFDAGQERDRQYRMVREWRRRLPPACRAHVRTTTLAVADRSGEGKGWVPFSRLTLTAQLEVLARPAEESFAACVPLNPFLGRWKAEARAIRLQAQVWPEQADSWLGGRAYGRRWVELLRRRPRSPDDPGTAEAIQTEFIRERLAPDHLYPLLWDAVT